MKHKWSGLRGGMQSFVLFDYVCHCFGHPVDALVDGLVVDGLHNHEGAQALSFFHFLLN